MTKRLFCFGFGYSAQALARKLTTSGWSIAGTARTEESRNALLEAGWDDVQLFSRSHPLEEPSAALAGATHLLSSIPPDDRGDPVLDLHGNDIADAGLEWVGYLSTTGVYGDRQGGEVDERSERCPASERSQRRVLAEDRWLALRSASDVPVHIFRLAGIYGPGRNALETVRQGRARRIRKPGQVFGRIHVDDIVATLRASFVRPDPGAAYNLADDEPASPDEVIAYACALLDIEPPAVEDFDTASSSMSPMARSFYGENKRVVNRRIKEELGVELAWPSYREGLRGLL